jgi:hypothetical protein
MARHMLSHESVAMDKRDVEEKIDKTLLKQNTIIFLPKISYLLHKSVHKTTVATLQQNLPFVREMFLQALLG